MSPDEIVDFFIINRDFLSKELNEYLTLYQKRAKILRVSILANQRWRENICLKWAIRLVTEKYNLNYQEAAEIIDKEFLNKLELLGGSINEKDNHT